MSSRAVAEPVRTCIGCRTRRPADELLRIVRTSDGVVAGGPSAGRGAWLCRRGRRADPGCVEAAIRRGAFQRAWRSPVDADAIDALRTVAMAGSPD